MRILAIDIGGTSIKLCISDERGNTEEFKSIDSESEKGGKHLMGKITQEITENFKDFDAIGISTAGQVDSVKGSIIYANENIPNYTGMNVKDIFEERFGVPVKVENDVNAAALGEKFFGIGKKYEDFLCLTYGTGVGGAIIIDSKIYKGYNGSAAEFGHMILHTAGETSPNRRTGYYEEYASTTALVREAKKLNGNYDNGKKIFEGLAKGDVELEKLFNKWVLEVAYGLVSLIHIFNPSAIIMGGGIMEQQRIITLVTSKVKELIMESFSSVAILKATLGNKAGLLGAVSLHLPKKN